ncbi:MAG: hypothetical protein WCZ87_03765 [Thiohalobacteraceae bacterium]
MTAIRKVLLLTSAEPPAKAGSSLDVTQLENALRARGAEVHAYRLDGSDPGALLDQLAEGAVPVLFRCGSNT